MTDPRMSETNRPEHEYGVFPGVCREGCAACRMSDKDLQARLARGERGIPKIPDSPDTRHAQAQPPRDFCREALETILLGDRLGQHQWLRAYGLSHSISLTNEPDGFVYEQIARLALDKTPAGPAEQPATPQYTQEDFRRARGEAHGDMYYGEAGAAQPSAPPQPAAETLVHIFRAGPEGECAICGEVDYSPIHKRKAGAAPIPYVSATRIVELPSVEVRQLPQGVIVKLMAVRDALIRKNYDEAYHQLYSIADPTFTLRDPFAEWENAVSKEQPHVSDNDR